MVLNLTICVSILLIIIAKFKFNSMIALLVVSALLGIMNGLPIEQIPQTIYNGFGSQIKSLALLITFGAVIGKLLNDSGASNQIAETLLKIFGKKNIQITVLSFALIIGITMFFEAAFIVLIPILYSLSQKMNLSLIYIGLPGVIGLSITHSFLPPHPGPAAVCMLYDADIGLTLILGLILVLPNAFLTGLFYSRSRWVNSINPPLPQEFIRQENLKKNTLLFFSGIFCILTPVILIVAPTILNFMSIDIPAVKFLGSPPLAMLVGVFISMYLLGIRQGMNLQTLNKIITQAAQSVVMIILIIGAGGAFKQIIVDTGIGTHVAAITQNFNFSPIITAWAMAALIRFAVGSATVAITIASGIMLNVVQITNIPAEIMVLATSTGSIFASHVNDPGFWLFKEYFNLSLIEALKIRTTYTCLLSITGLIGVLLLNFFFAV